VVQHLKLSLPDTFYLLPNAQLIDSNRPPLECDLRSHLERSQVDLETS